jgi:hypothetical protein
MASPVDSEDDVSFSFSFFHHDTICGPNWSNSNWQVFESLTKKIDPQVEEERERAVRERVQAQVEKAQQRLAELVSTISNPVLLDTE